MASPRLFCWEPEGLLRRLQPVLTVRGFSQSHRCLVFQNSQNWNVALETGSVLGGDITRKAPSNASYHPPQPVIGSRGFASGVPGELYLAPFCWGDISDSQARWTLKEGNSRLFHLSRCHRNRFDKRASNSLTNCRSTRL